MALRYSLIETNKELCKVFSSRFQSDNPWFRPPIQQDISVRMGRFLAAGKYRRHCEWGRPFQQQDVACPSSQIRPGEVTDCNTLLVHPESCQYQIGWSVIAPFGGDSSVPSRRSHSRYRTQAQQQCNQYSFHTSLQYAKCCSHP